MACILPCVSETVGHAYFHRQERPRSDRTNDSQRSMTENLFTTML
jgi:hypothetical protein